LQQRIADRLEIGRTTDKPPESENKQKATKRERFAYWAALEMRGGVEAPNMLVDAMPRFLSVSSKLLRDIAATKNKKTNKQTKQNKITTTNLSIAGVPLRYGREE
jgi:hypothetical protein